MSSLRKLLAAGIAILLCVGSTGPAMADEGKVIVIPSPFENHSAEPDDGSDATGAEDGVQGGAAPGSMSVAYQVLQREDQGDEVTRLQSRLAELNYYSTRAIDGDYGNMTCDSVIVFQRLNGLEQTGVADAQTQALLYEGSPVRYALPDASEMTLTPSGSSGGPTLSCSSANASSYMSEQQGSRTLVWYPSNVLNDSDRYVWAMHGRNGWISVSMSGKRQVSGFSMRNGFQQESRTYYNNNRLKTVNVYADGTLIGSVTLSDTMGTQYVVFNQPLLIEELKIELTSVYPANVDDDTCVSSIRLTGIN